MSEVTFTKRDTYKVTWKDSIEWLLVIFVFTIVNWFFALFSSLPTIIILYYYSLQSYIGTALSGFALAYTAFTLRKWHIISKCFFVSLISIDRY